MEKKYQYLPNSITAFPCFFGFEATKIHKLNLGTFFGTKNFQRSLFNPKRAGSGHQGPSLADICLPIFKWLELKSSPLVTISFKTFKKHRPTHCLRFFFEVKVLCKEKK